MNWDSPEERAALIERIGITAYNKAFEAYVNESTTTTISGHAIRPVGSRFGSLYQCGNTGKAFRTLREAEEYARNNPVQ